MKKRILSLCLLSVFLGNISFAQTQNSANKTKILTIDELENQKSKKFDANEKRVFSPEEINSMEALIAKKDFANLYDYLKNVKVSPANYINYLESKRDLGIVPLYWLMADYYSFQPNAVEATHFWSSVAVITTAQDAEICNDPTARFAAQKMIKSFPNSQSVIARTPQYIDTTMPKVKFFISNLKTRITPEWVCVFGDSYNKYKNNLLLNRNEWDQKRNEVFKRFTSKFSN